MRPALALKARSTHLYPGAQVVLVGGQIGQTDAPGPIPCLVEFSDGAAAFGDLIAAGPRRVLLALGAYRTVAGTKIAAKYWWLVPGAVAGDGQECRITGPADQSQVGQI